MAALLPSLRKISMDTRIGIIMHPSVHFPGVHDDLARFQLMGETEDIGDLYGHEFSSCFNDNDLGHGAYFLQATLRAVWSLPG